MIRGVLICLTLSVVALSAAPSCNTAPARSLADDVLREGDDLARQLDNLPSYQGADDVLRQAENNRTSFEDGVEAVDSAKDVAGFVGEDVCEYLDAYVDGGSQVSAADLETLQPSLETSGTSGRSAATEIADAYAGASDKQGFVYGACMTIHYIGEAG